MQNARREYNVADLARQRGGWLCFFSIGLVLAASIVQGTRRVLRMLCGQLFKEWLLPLLLPSLLIPISSCCCAQTLMR